MGSKSFIENKSIAYSLFISILFIFFYHSSAIGNIHFGSLEFHPFFNTTAGYADNVNMIPEGDINEREKSSVYTSYSPGLNCDWNKNNHEIRLSYFYEFLNYNKEEIHDRELFDLDSKIDFRFEKSGKKIDLSGGYKYRKTFDPFSTEQQAYDRKETSSKFAAGFNFMDRFGLGFASGLIQHRFMDAEPARRYNKDVISFFSKASIRPFTKTDILLEYGLIMNEYNDPNKASYYDSKTHFLLTGIEWAVSAKISGTIKSGYQWKYYDDPNEIGLGSPETWRAEVDLRYTFSELTSFQLRFERNIEDSDFRYAGREAGFYYSNQIQFTAKHKFNYKLETWLDIFYNYSNYNKVSRENSREDEVWQFDLGLSYQFRDWIGAGLKYRARIRDTKIVSVESISDNNSDLDYKSDQISIELNIIF
ncbi:MAG: outer membrane beta-barrel protein [bacterium]